MGANNRYVDKRINDCVICQLCKREFKQITSTHLAKEHNITFKEYKKLFPSEETLVQESRNKIIANSRKLVLENKIGFKKGHKINEGKTPWNKGGHGLQTSWRKGKNKNNCEKVLLAAMKVAETKRKMYANGTIKRKTGKDNPMYGRKLNRNHKLALLHGNISYGSKPEMRVWSFLKEYDEWEYSAKTKFCIDLGEMIKNPDFVNRRKKQVIEVYGDYWHRNDNPSELITLYGEYGWKCVVLWEHEIMNKTFGSENIYKVMEDLNESK